jgi:hypothetical protein
MMKALFLFIYLQCKKCNEKLTKLKGGAVQISPAEKDRVILNYSVLQICLNIRDDSD